MYPTTQAPLRAISHITARGARRQAMKYKGTPIKVSDSATRRSCQPDQYTNSVARRSSREQPR